MHEGTMGFVASFSIRHWICAAVMEPAIGPHITFPTLKPHAKLLLGSIHLSFCNPLDFPRLLARPFGGGFASFALG